MLIAKRSHGRRQRGVVVLDELLDRTLKPKAIAKRHGGWIMNKFVATLAIALLMESLVGCSLASFPIPDVAVTPSPSTEDRQACDRAAYDAGESRPPVMSRWLVIPEVIFWPMSEVVFLALMIGLSKNPNASERAQLEAWQRPYTQCLIAKGYKSQ